MPKLKRTTSELRRKTVFTTGECAIIIEVAPRTVSKWFDSGELKGYRIPGSQDRRIPRRCLLEFLKKHDIPAGPWAGRALRVLAVGPVPEIDHEADIEWQTCDNFFAAGSLLSSFFPDVVVFNFAVGPRSECLWATQTIVACEFPTRLIVLANEDEGDLDALTTQLPPESVVFQRPVNVYALATAIRTIQNNVMPKEL